MKKRKDINELDENQISDYIHALNILRARSESNPDDESGYNFQADLHNDSFIGPCEHGNISLRGIEHTYTTSKSFFRKRSTSYSQ